MDSLLSVPRIQLLAQVITTARAAKVNTAARSLYPQGGLNSIAATFPRKKRPTKSQENHAIKTMTVTVVSASKRVVCVGPFAVRITIAQPSFIVGHIVFSKKLVLEVATPNAKVIPTALKIILARTKRGVIPPQVHPSEEPVAKKAIVPQEETVLAIGKGATVLFLAPPLCKSVEVSTILPAPNLKSAK